MDRYVNPSFCFSSPQFLRRARDREPSFFPCDLIIVFCFRFFYHHLLLSSVTRLGLSFVMLLLARSVNAQYERMIGSHAARVSHSCLLCARLYLEL